jgi:hypothetical protein
MKIQSESSPLPASKRRQSLKAAIIDSRAKVAVEEIGFPDGVCGSISSPQSRAPELKRERAMHGDHRPERRTIDCA